MSAPAVAPPAAPAPPAPAPPTPAPPAAPAAPQTPAAPAAPAAPAKPETGADDEGLKSLFKDLGVVLEDKKPAEQPTPQSPAPAPAPGAPSPAAPAPPATTPQPGAPASPAAAPASPSPKVRKEKPISEIVAESVRKTLKETPPAQPSPPTPSTPAAPAAPQDDPFEQSLGPAEKRTIAIAKWAETNDPAKRAGLVKQFVDFYKAVDAYESKVKAEDPERTLDENDEAFQKFIEDHRPQVDQVELRGLEMEMVKAEAVAAAEKNIEAKMKADLEATRKRQASLELKPVIEKRLSQFQAAVEDLLVKTAEPDSVIPDIIKTIQEKGIEEALKTEPTFTPLIAARYQEGANAATEYMALVNQLKPYEPSNPTHQWIAGFIRDQGNYFERNGGDARIRKAEDGRELTFLPRAKFVQLVQQDPAAANSHWTFTEDDVLGMLEVNTRHVIANEVKGLQQRLVASGYARPPKAAGSTNGTPQPPAAKPPDQPPEPSTSPKAGASPAPGPAVPGSPANRALTASELQALGIPVLP